MAYPQKRTQHFKQPNLYWVPYTARAKSYEILNQVPWNTPEELAAQQSQTWISDYNDPYAINSIADLVLTTFNPDMKRMDLGGVEDIPILNIVTGLFTDIIWDKNIKPIVEGAQQGKVGEGLGAAGLNFLTNIAETLDIVANPVKGLVLGGGEGFVDAMGWGENGRKNFDYDIEPETNEDFVWNIVFEIISDPLNYISFGTAGAAKAGVKAAVKEGISEAAEAVGKEILTEAAEAAGKATVKEVAAETAEQAVKGVASGFAKNTLSGISEEAVQAIANRTWKIFWNGTDDIKKLGMRWMGTNGISFGDAYKQAVKEVTTNNAFVKGTLKGGVKPITNIAVDDTLKKVLNHAIDYIQVSKHAKTLSALRSVYGVSENIQKGLMRSAWNTTLPGMVWQGGKLIRLAASNNAITKAVQAQLADALKHTPVEELDFSTYFKAAGETPFETSFARQMRTAKEYMMQSGKMSAEEVEVYVKQFEEYVRGDALNKTLTSIIDDTKLTPAQKIDAIKRAVAKNVTGNEEAYDDAISLFLSSDSTTLNQLGKNINEVLTDLASEKKVLKNALNKIIAAPDNNGILNYLRYVDGDASSINQLYKRLIDNEQYNTAQDLLRKYINQMLKHADGVLDEASTAGLREAIELLEQGPKGFIVASRRITNAYKLFQKYNDTLEDTILTRPLGKVLDDLHDTLSSGNVDAFIEATEQVISKYGVRAGVSERATKIVAFNSDAVKGFKEGGALYDDIVRAMQPLKNELVDTKPYGYSWNRIANAFDELVYNPSPAAVADLQYEVAALTKLMQDADITDPTKVFSAAATRSLINDADALDDVLQHILDDATLYKGTKAAHLFKLVNEQMYNIKLSKLYINTMLHNDPAIQALITPQTLESIFALIENNVVDDSAAHVLSFALGLSDDAVLYSTIKNSMVLAQHGDLKLQAYVADALMDTLQTYANRPLTSILRSQESLDAFTQELMRNITMQFNEFNGSARNTVDALIEHFKLGDLTKDLQAHVGRDDVIRQLLVTSKLYNANNLGAVPHIIMDIETTGLNKHLDEICEIAYIPYDKTTVDAVTEALQQGDVAAARKYVQTYQIATTRIPTVERIALDVSIDDAIANGLAKQIDGVWVHDLTQTDAWVQFWKQSHAGTTTTVDDVYRMIDADLMSRYGSVDVRIIAHNGVDFDFPVLKKHNMLDGSSMLSRALNNTDNVDTLLLARKQNGYLFLTEAEELEIHKIISEHLVRRMQHVSQNMVEFNKLLTTPTRHIQNEMHLLYKALNDAGTEFQELANVVSAANTAIADNFKLARTFTNEYSNVFINRALYSGEVVDLGVKSITGHVRLYSDALSSVRVVNTATLSEYFNIVDAEATMQHFANLSYYATKIQRIKESVCNVDALTESVLNDLKKIIKDAPTMLKKHNPKNTYRYALLRLPENPDSIYAVARQLYNDYWGLVSKDKLAFKDAFKISYDTLEVLTDSRLMTLPAESAASKALHAFDMWDDTKTIEQMLDIITEQNAIRSEQIALLDKVTDAQGLFKSTDKANVVIQQKLLPGIKDTITKYKNAIKRVDRTTLRQWGHEFQTTNTIALLDHMSKLSNNELAAFVWTHGKGHVVIDTSLFADASAKEVWLETLLNNNPKQINSLADGLIVRKIDNHKYALAIRKDAATLFKKQAPPTGVVTKRLTQGSRNAVDNTCVTFETLYQPYVKGRGGLSNGNLIDPTTMRDIEKQMVDFFDEPIVSVDELCEAGAFSGVNFDYSIIGTRELRAQFLPNVSFDPVRIRMNTAQKLLTQADALTKYQAALFNDNSLFLVNNIFKNVKEDAVIQELFNNKHLKLVYLVPDSTSVTGYAVKSIQPTHKVIRLAKAGKVKVAVFTEAMFNDAAGVINRWEISNPLMKIFQKILVPMQNAGYLQSFGWVFRNFVDSTTKTGIATGSASDMITSIAAASSYYVKYVDTLKHIIAASDGGFPTASAFKKVLGEMTEEDAMLFRQVHALFESSAGGGQIDALQQLVKLGNNADGIDKAAKAVQDFLWDKLPTGRLAKLTNEPIENINRLAVFFNELRYGAGTSEALSKVIATHFNFATTSKLGMYLNMVIPFASFRINNLKFWADAFDSYGWLASLLRDVMVPILNMDEYNNYEVNHNRSLQYQLLAGNVILDDNTVLKLSLSVMDAFGILTNPVDNLAGNLTSYLSLPLEAVKAQIKGEPWDAADITRNITTNLPVVGPAFMKYFAIDTNKDGEIINVGSAIKAYERTENGLTKVLPSVFGGVQRQYYFSYEGSNTIYCTPDFEKFQAFLSNGAYAVTDAAIYEEMRLREPERKQRVYTPKRTYYPKKVYPKRYYPKRRYPKRTYHKRTYHKRTYAKKVYATKTYANTSYIPRSASMMFDAVSYNALQRNPRAGGRPPILYRSPHTSRAFYKKMYTGRGQNLWKTRLLPVTPYTLKYRIRMSWSYLR